MASASVYLFRPDQYNWLVRMADAHNMGFQNKTLKETVDYELKYQRRAVETKLRTLSKRRLEHTDWRRVCNCRLPDRVQRQVQTLAASYRVDFADCLCIIVADAVSRISRDRALEESIFEAPRSVNCTSTLIRDLKRQQRTAARGRTR